MEYGISMKQGEYGINQQYPKTGVALGYFERYILTLRSKV
jgi:hypothetical protein